MFQIDFIGMAELFFKKGKRAAKTKITQDIILLGVREFDQRVNGLLNYGLVGGGATAKRFEKNKGPKRQSCPQRETGRHKKPVQVLEAEIVEQPKGE